jgi:hypothetical protein
MEAGKRVASPISQWSDYGHNLNSEAGVGDRRSSPAVFSSDRIGSVMSPEWLKRLRTSSQSDST